MYTGTKLDAWDDTKGPFDMLVQRFCQLVHHRHASLSSGVLQHQALLGPPPLRFVLSLYVPFDSWTKVLALTHNAYPLHIFEAF
jgi:hypothetical protein